MNGLQSVVEAIRLQIQNNRDVLLQEMKSFNGARLTPTGRNVLCPAGPACLRQQFGGDLQVPAAEGIGCRRCRAGNLGWRGISGLSFSGTVKDVTEGIARIKWALDPTSPNEIYIGDRKMIRDWL